MSATTLRPIERRMAQLADDGMDEVEIAWRFRRSPRYVRQVIDLTERPGRNAGERRTGDGLRPLERRLLRWRAAGHDLESLAPRFRRSARFLGQVERLAHYKLSQR